MRSLKGQMGTGMAVMVVAVLIAFAAPIVDAATSSNLTIYALVAAGVVQGIGGWIWLSGVSVGSGGVTPARPSGRGRVK